MIRLIGLGVLASFFFSGTFVLNQWMDMVGGHWFWTAALRFGFVFILLTIFIVLRYGVIKIRNSAACFYRHWCFWILSGGVGFGCFYCALCFAASYAPGWVVATTWQSTILATPLVLRLMGKKVPGKGVVFALVVFAGIVLVNLNEFTVLSIKIAGGVLPVMIAAICYPFGNSLCGFAKNGDHPSVPHIKDKVMDNTLCRVWMMTVGALPVLVIPWLIVQPYPPSIEQLFGTACLAITGGIIATTIFLYARHTAENSFEIVAVDSTQAFQVPFALLIGYFLIGGSIPTIIEIVGLVFVTVGITCYLFFNPINSKS